MSVPAPGVRRRGFVWLGLTAVLAALAVAVAVVVLKSDPAPPPHVCCAPPPQTSGIDGVPQQWRTAVAHGDAQAAWSLLTPEAQRRYRSVSGLRAALTGLKARPRGAATWRRLDGITQGRGTPSAFFYMLIEDRTLRPVSAVVVHSLATGAHDGRVDPGVAGTVRILEPAARATVGTRPRIRVATSSPPGYVAVQASGQIFGARGAIRGADGLDAPFDEAMKPGPALIVAVVGGSGRFTYGSVRVTVR